MTISSSEMGALQRQVHALSEGLAAVAAERAVRNVLARYMVLCDQPCDDTDYPRLGDLFTADAVWEGIGSLYTQTFGKQQGRADITAFLGRYLAPSKHFKMNMHCLTSDQVRVDGDCAWGQWVMLQASTYENDRTELVCARLTIDFVRQDGEWCIAHFRTARMFDLPWTVPTGGLPE